MGALPGMKVNKDCAKSASMAQKDQQSGLSMNCNELGLENGPHQERNHDIATESNARLRAAGERILRGD
jgi:hypothetical protein